MKEGEPKNHNQNGNESGADWMRTCISIENQTAKMRRELGELKGKKNKKNKKKKKIL